MDPCGTLANVQSFQWLLPISLLMAYKFNTVVCNNYYLPTLHAY